MIRWLISWVQLGREEEEEPPPLPLISEEVKKDREKENIISKFYKKYYQNCVNLQSL